VIGFPAAGLVAVRYPDDPYSLPHVFPADHVRLIAAPEEADTPILVVAPPAGDDV
jgi:hypothetical protein